MSGQDEFAVRAGGAQQQDAQERAVAERELLLDRVAHEFLDGGRVLPADVVDGAHQGLGEGQHQAGGAAGDVDEDAAQRLVPGHQGGQAQLQFGGVGGGGDAVAGADHRPGAVGDAAQQPQPFLLRGQRGGGVRAALGQHLLQGLAE